MSDGKKKLAVWVEGAIVANLQRWQEEYDKSESEVVRVALILGLQALKRDPSPLGMPRLDPDSISPPPRKAQDEATPTGTALDAMHRAPSAVLPPEHPSGPTHAPKEQKKAPPFDPLGEPTPKQLRDNAKKARGGR